MDSDWIPDDLTNHKFVLCLSVFNVKQEFARPSEGKVRARVRCEML